MYRTQEEQPIPEEPIEDEDNAREEIFIKFGKKIVDCRARIIYCISRKLSKAALDIKASHLSGLFLCLLPWFKVVSLLIASPSGGAFFFW